MHKQTASWQMLQCTHIKSMSVSPSLFFFLAPTHRHTHRHYMYIPRTFTQLHCRVIYRTSYIKLLWWFVFHEFTPTELYVGGNLTTDHRNVPITTNKILPFYCSNNNNLKRSICHLVADLITFLLLYWIYRKTVPVAPVPCPCWLLCPLIHME